MKNGVELVAPSSGEQWTNKLHNILTNLHFGKVFRIEWANVASPVAALFGATFFIHVDLVYLPRKKTVMNFKMKSGQPKSCCSIYKCESRKIIARDMHILRQIISTFSFISQIAHNFSFTC